jgi:hypothetical protein
MDAIALDFPRKDFGSEACFQVLRCISSLRKAFANGRRYV